jgi:hypothetical protein
VIHLMRKYGKWVLAILGVVLMISWVGNIGSGKGRDPGNDDYVRGSLDGKTIRNVQIHNSEGEIATLQQLRLYRPLVPISQRENGTHWFLLWNEAQKQGITATEAEITDLIKSANISSETLENYIAKANSNQAFIRQAVKHMLMINRLGEIAVSSVPVSEPQLEYMADQIASTVQVSYATLDADKAVRGGATPAEQLLQKQFALYKGVIASDGQQEPPLIDGHTYPFGYKWPDRIKVEYLTFDKGEVRARLKPTQEDLLEALRFYNANPDKFKSDAAKSDLIGPATAPSIKPFDEVKAKLIQNQIDARAELLIKKMTERAIALAQDPWKTQSTDLKGFRDTLPTAQWTAYTAIADNIAHQKDFLGYRPTVSQPPMLLSEQSLANLAGIGNAVLVNQQQRQLIPFARLATRVKELLADNDPLARLFLQVGVEGPLLIDREGNSYLYRVAAAEKSHEPANLDEEKVRGLVVDDLQRLAAYERLKSLAQTLAKTAQTGDLNLIAKPEGYPVTTTPPLARLEPIYDQYYGFPMGVRPSNVPGLGNLPEFVAAAFSLVNKLPATAPATTGPAATAPTLHPTTTLPVERKLQVYVLELLNYEPCPIDTFNQRRGLYAMLAMSERRRSFLLAWSNLDSVAARMKYVPSGGFSKETGE